MEKKQTEIKGKLKVKIEDRLLLLKQEFKRNLQDVSDTKLAELNMARNVFLLNKEILSKNLQEEFSEMKCNSEAKINLKAMPMTDF